MKTHTTLQLAGLLACTFLATAGFISAQTQPTEATKERLRAQAQKIREELRFATVDRNRNGWDDAWEKKYPAFTADKTGDSDGDGISNWEEMLDGTDPARANKKGEVYVSPEDKARQLEEQQLVAAKRAIEIAAKVNAGLDTAARRGPAERKSGWLTEDRQKQELLEVSRQAAIKEAADLVELDRQIPPGAFRDLVNSGEVRVKRVGADGVPVIIGSHALAGADSISTDELWPGGTSSVLDVKGGANIVGIWEVGGSPWYAHAEFPALNVPGQGTLSRLLYGDTAALNNSAVHATWVGSVIAGAGTLAAARGMSYEARLQAYNDVGDFNETATAAAAGMKLSNHSYGLYAGWTFDGSVSNLQWVWTGENVAGEDKRFGYYGVESRKVDLVCYNSPNYLPVYSSGTDVADTGPAAGEGHWFINPSTMQYNFSAVAHPSDGAGGGYDSLPGTAVAKNALVVGAANPVPGGYSGGSVSIANFSSRGPTDDGRIKPDLVADGVDVVAAQLELERPYSVQNASFEAAGLAVGGSTSATANWTQNPQSGGWAEVHRIQFSGGFNFAGFGTHTAALVGTGTQIYQDLSGVTLQANTTYRITARVGRLNGFTDSAATYRLKVYTNGFTTLMSNNSISSSSVALDQFSSVSFSFTTSGSAPPGNVRLVLEHAGPLFVTGTSTPNYLFFDAVDFRAIHNVGALPTNVYSDDSLLGREKVDGTSFAAPAATGSLNLLQELNTARAGPSFWASTWKTLAIATADDVGSTGPDYTFGWGLMNTKKAAELLDKQLTTHRRQLRPSFIRQNTLFDGNIVEYKVKAQGGVPLVVTLGYTDPAYQNATANESGGLPANTLDSTTSMLINDLDVEIVTPASTVLGPWLLNPSSPSAAATASGTGNDDDRNNVKQVRIEAASVVAGGIYTVRVKQDGVLRVAKIVPSTTNYELVTSQTNQPAFQRYSVVITGNVERQEDTFEMTDIVHSPTEHYMQWKSVKGLRYQLQTSTDMFNWSDVPGEVNATGELTSLTLTQQNPNETRRFYRVKEVGS